jgi:hypothetical protein
MSKKLVAAVISAVAILLVVATSAMGRSSAGSSTTEHFYLRFAGLTSGSPNTKPGATVTARSIVFDKRGGRRLGRTSELCTMTVAAPVTMQCSISVIMWGSSSFTVVGGFNPGKTPYRAALAGGTGRYEGAHGALLSQTAKGAAENWTITYTR